MPYEDVEDKSVLREGDLVLFDAIPSPTMVLGRLLRTGELVDVSSVKFASANNPRNTEMNKILNESFRIVYENVAFVCKFSDGKLRILSGAELLDLMMNPDAERNMDKIHKDIAKKPHLRQFFYALEYKDEGD